MNKETIHKTAQTWAAETDPRIRVDTGWVSHGMELITQTSIFHSIRSEITGQRFEFIVLIPHARRTPMYFFGPEARECEEEDFLLPSFDDAAGLRLALEIVHRRFMTAHGMQRFDDSEIPMPDSFRPDLLESCRRWVGMQKTKYEIREIREIRQTPGAGRNGIEIHRKGKTQRGLHIRIGGGRSHPQQIVFDKSGSARWGVLPAFYTEAELLGALDNASRQIDLSLRHADNQKTE